MKNILKYIPGFRSNVKWKKILAIIYYIFSLLMMLVGFDLFIFLLAMPFFIFSIAKSIKAKGNNKPTKATALVLLVSLGAIIGSLNYSDPSIEVMKELEQSKDADIAQEDKETIEEVELADKQEVDKKDPEIEEDEIEEDKIEEIIEEIQEDSFEGLHNLQVHFLDVGQGDSTLIQLPNGDTMLIDGGTRSSGGIVLDYLNSLKIAKIDYLIATHPHEDHIGGLIEVINRHTIGEIYMPKISHTTKTFEDLLIAIKNKDKKVRSAKAGDKILDKEGLSIEIVAPEENESDSNLNKHSVVIRLQYKDNSFLFTGDAEKESENKMVDKGYNLKSHVLKVGHHGSSTSTTDVFLNKVDPEYAVISCGSGNKYGHPTDEIINRLNENNIKIYRTDRDGTVVATSDGGQITFDKK